MTTRPIKKNSVAMARKPGARVAFSTVIASGEERALMSGVRDYFAHFGWPPVGARILTALSGGPDSVATLWVLTVLAANRRWEIAAAHVNYGLRGRESDRDEAFCRDLCRRWGIRLWCSRRKRGRNRLDGNLQAWAREIRYQFLERIADRNDYGWIAVGHHIGDRAETVAAAVLEAAGTFALSGIPPVRGRIIRPLFDCAPEAIRNFLQASKIPYRTDRSNAAMSYQRNRIRHKTIPTWEADNPSIVRGLARLGEQLWWQQSYLDREADRRLRRALIEEGADRVVFDAGRLARVDRSLDPFILRQLIRRVGLTLVPTASTVDRFTELRCGRVSGRIEQGQLVVESSKGQIAAHRRSMSRAGQGLCSVDPLKWQVRTEVVDGVARDQFDDRRQVFLDLSKVHQPVRLRLLEAGDRYRPLGLGGTKKLLDLLADHKVPVFQRRQVPVLTDQTGILWPVGQPIADRVKVTRRTRQILRVMVQPL